MKWFCRLCWRSGPFPVNTPVFPYEAALAAAIKEHELMIEIDKKANRPPAGMERFSGASFMDKYPGVDCVGAIQIGTIVKKRSRKRDKTPPLPLEGES
jgi:hypothetical protein